MLDWTLTPHTNHHVAESEALPGCTYRIHADSQGDHWLFLSDFALIGDPVALSYFATLPGAQRWCEAREAKLASNLDRVHAKIDRVLEGL